MAFQVPGSTNTDLKAQWNHTGTRLGKHYVIHLGLKVKDKNEIK